MSNKQSQLSQLELASLSNKIANLERFVPFVLFLHGSIILLYQGASIWQWIAMGIILVLGIWNILGRFNFKKAMYIKAGIILFITGWLLFSDGVENSHFLFWYFVFVSIYPLLCPNLPRLLVVLGVPVAYLIVLPFSIKSLSIFVILTIAFLLAFIANLTYSVGLTIAHHSTDLQKTKLALLNERNMLYTLINNIPDYIYAKDVKSRFLIVNNAVANLIGVSQLADLIGKTDYDFYPLPTADRYYADDQQVITSGIPLINKEETIIDIHGKQHTILTSKAPLFNKQGDIIGLVSLGRDITERRRAQSKLEENQEHFRRFITSISDHVYVGELTATGEYHPLYHSPHIEPLTGYPLDKFMTDWDFWVSTVVYEDDRDIVIQQADKLANGQESETEYRLLRADGTVIWIRDSARVELQHDSKIIYGVVSDITARKHVEAELRQSQAELARERALLTQRVAERTSELSVANAELFKAARLKDEFLANISHELRTPLNAILGMSEVVRMEMYGPLNLEQIGMLEQIEESGRHLLSLINNILNFSKISAGKLKLNFSYISLEKLCEDIFAIIKPLAEQKRINLITQIDDTITTFQADEYHLKQILINLLDNAIKFTPEDGDVGLEIKLNKRTNVIEFIVWDTGIGIKEEDIEYLFRPFIQLDSRLAKQYEGTGLGLALVYRLTEMHGGSINVKSQFRQGSQFIVSIPRKPSSFKSGDDVSTLNTDDNTASPINILVAEDHQVNAATLRDFLEANNYTVTLAYNGVEAVEQAKEIIPDLILMDIQMPIMDGLEATRHIREEEALATIPIIVITALALPGGQDRSIEAGATRYMVKPLNFSKLLKVIDNQLNEKN